MSGDCTRMAPGGRRQGGSPGWEIRSGSDDEGFLGSASPARVYDYWLGGKDHFPRDRQVGDAISRLAPWAVATARANRRFLISAVAYLAGVRGVDQFIDLGSGLPTSPNVHQVAQWARPGARTVYVDHDPAVLAHGRALLECDAGAVVIGGDLRDPTLILSDPRLNAAVDWSRPVGVLLGAVLHFLTDHDEAAAAVGSLRDALVPGSFLVISHATPGPPHRSAATLAAVALYGRAVRPIALRTAGQLTELLDGFDLVAPGLVPVTRHRPPGRPALPVSCAPAAGHVVAGIARRTGRVGGG